MVRTVVLAVVLFGTGTACARQADPPPVPITTGETLTISSAHLGETRPVHVYLPPSYADGARRYPVVYVLDGEVAFQHTASAAQFLGLYGRMPEVLVVAVPNTDRLRDMPIPDAYGRGGEERFLSFLADELTPLVDRRYRTQPLRVLGGHSQGGLFAVYAMATRPDAFSWIVAIDAPLFGVGERLKDAVRRLVQEPGYRGRLVSVERTLGWLGDWDALAAVDAPGFRAHRLTVADETHETMTYEGTYEAFKHLFADYAPDDLTTKTLDDLDAEYAPLSEQYGYAIPVPRRLLLRNADDLLSQARGPEARAMLERVAAVYGTAAVPPAYRTRLADVLRQGPLDETVDDVLAYPAPTPEAMAPFLGVWKGRFFSADGRGVPMDVTVTFAVDDGRVTGETVLTGPGGMSQRSPHVVTRLLEGKTLEWGYMNGMRPRGVIVYSGRVDDAGVFYGTQEMRGVRMQFPPGYTPTTWHVELRREEGRETGEEEGQRDEDAQIL